MRSWLAFFPKLLRCAFPCSWFARPENRGKTLSESTIIEFGTAREVLFACATPLEFADVLRLRNADGSLDTEASVVAVQYHSGKTVIAARFLREVPNWIVKP